MNPIITGDCRTELRGLKSGTIQLSVNDPPYNMGREYDVHDDKMAVDEYLEMSREWISQVHRVLHPNGSFWVAISDNLVSELDVLCKSIGFHKRGQIVWAFTFGVNQTKNFTRAHCFWLYYTKHKSKFTFNAEDPQLRHPSARQLVYNDKRANPAGRLPDDVWILRQSELQELLTPDLDVWLQSRVCGTYKERVAWMDNQMPEAILERIIRASSNEGDTVLDCFAGSGSTLCVAKKLGRSYCGFELSPEYAKRANARLRVVQPGDPIGAAGSQDGAA